uniref:Uncharacterized protein n=1 Tax=Otolemur garnettii TaxID=30611 RepID=H0XXB8_OTOGA
YDISCWHLEAPYTMPHVPKAKGKRLHLRSSVRLRLP